MPNPNNPIAVTVNYTPGSANPWSQDPSKKIKVKSGTTELDWTIVVVPASAGTIQFNTSTSAPGIQFTGTGNSAWPGSLPTGNATGWTSTLTNSIPKGANAVDYHYVVNALFTLANGTQTAVKWDPDVEADPPTLTPLPAE